MTPRQQEKVFIKSYAVEMLRIAKADLTTAEALQGIETIRKENAAFHAQQAIEKSLKAVLVALEVPVPMVHDAGILIAKLPDKVSPPLGYDLSELTQFATVRRYEEGSSHLTKEELQTVIDIANTMFAWAEMEIQKALP